MKRWVIKADGIVVGHEYASEQKAWRKARQYELQCLNQDEPYAPVMTVEEECLLRDDKL